MWLKIVFYLANGRRNLAPSPGAYNVNMSYTVPYRGSLSLTAKPMRAGRGEKITEAGHSAGSIQNLSKYSGNGGGGLP